MKTNKRISNRLMMYIVVLTLCLGNDTLLTGFTAIWSLVQTLKTKKEQLQSLIMQKLLIETGLSKDKLKLKQQLADLAYTIGAAIYSYADSQGNNTLRDKVGYTISKLLRMRATNLTEVCNTYLDLATENLTNLAGYNIDQTLLITFSEAISMFSESIDKPISAIEHRATLTQEINMTDAEIMSLLKKQLDKGMPVVKAANASFVREYFNSRKIWDLGIRHRTVTEDPDEIANIAGNVVDTDGNPMEDVEAVLMNETRTYLGSTDEDGDFYFEGVVKGDYTLTISYYGKKTITEIINVNTNDEIRKDYVMEDEVVIP